jgi:trehalose/maltose hydrolase-like predicted phosphorylase
VPLSSQEGLINNFYTNVMVVWTFKKAFKLLKEISNESKKRIFQKIKITDKELIKWKDIIQKLNLAESDEGIFAQFDGYFDLKELDWKSYQKKYHNIQRLDRILRAEGESADDYKVSKQADLLMTYYNLNSIEIEEIIKGLGYKVTKDTFIVNYDYYSKRTSHGSTLSLIVHAYLLSLLGRKEESYNLYLKALKSDYQDIQGGTTGEGIHTGVMGATIMVLLRAFAGIDFSNNMIKIKPNLPSLWREISFNFTFREINYQIIITKNILRIALVSPREKIVSFEIKEKIVSVKADTPNRELNWTDFNLNT